MAYNGTQNWTKAGGLLPALALFFSLISLVLATITYFQFLGTRHTLDAAKHSSPEFPTINVVPCQSSPDKCQNQQKAALDDALQKALANLKEKSEASNPVEAAITHYEAELANISAAVFGATGIALATAVALLVMNFLSDWRVRESVKELEELKEKAEKKFPRFQKLEGTITEISEELEEHFKTENQDDKWYEKLYSQIEPELRLKINSIEPFLSLDFLGRKLTAHSLRCLSSFFYTKYDTGKNTSDLDRALNFATRAHKTGNGGFQYKNDLGFIYMAYGELASGEGRKDDAKQYYGVAETHFVKSCEIHPDQIRAHYNLGLIYKEQANADPARKLELLQKNVKTLEDGFSKTKWEVGDQDDRSKAQYSYNRACAHARLGDVLASDKQENSYISAVQILEAMGKTIETYMGKKTLDDDKETGGAFYGLHQWAVTASSATGQDTKTMEKKKLGNRAIKALT